MERQSHFEMLQEAATVVDSIGLVGGNCDEERVIVFDWDDTLLASTWVAKHGLRPRYSTKNPDIPLEIRIELRELEDLVIEVLTTALDFGRVVIVTAAEAGWVELSASLFMPRCLPIIESAVRVVSARTTYEAAYPASPAKWKFAAFHQEIFLNNADTIPKHVISFGDGASERQALISISEMERRVFGKSMKFITRPTVEELRQQVEMVLTSMEYMCTHRGNLDLELSKPMIRQGVCTSTA